MTTHTPDLHELRGFDDDKFALADLSEPTQAYIRERNELRAQRDELLDALQMVLPLAERYLHKAPDHPDNAKLETARAAIQKAQQ